MARTHNLNGDLTPYALALGSVQRYGSATLTRENGAYIVRCPERREGFRTLTQARRALRSFGAGLV